MLMPFGLYGLSDARDTVNLAAVARWPTGQWSAMRAMQVLAAHRFSLASIKDDLRSFEKAWKAARILGSHARNEDTFPRCRAFDDRHRPHSILLARQDQDVVAVARPERADGRHARR